jgi:hypothetical protein
MEHRGYTGTVEYDAIEGIFHGVVEHLDDTITYEADCLARLEAAFRDSIDTYIEACLGCEETPEPPPSRPPIGRRRTRRGSRDALPRPATIVILSLRALDCPSRATRLRLLCRPTEDAHP